jgi:hypothetical protein
MPVNKAHDHDKICPKAGSEDDPFDKFGVRCEVVGKWLEADIPIVIDGSKDRRKNSDNRASGTTADARPHGRPKRSRG